MQIGLQAILDSLSLSLHAAESATTVHIRMLMFPACTSSRDFHSCVQCCNADYLVAPTMCSVDRPQIEMRCWVGDMGLGGIVVPHLCSLSRLQDDCTGSGFGSLYAREIVQNSWNKILKPALHYIPSLLLNTNQLIN